MTADPAATRPWDASDHVPAPDLGRLIAERCPLNERELRIPAAHLAATPADVHALGLAHRDLKPSNVLMPADRRPPRHRLRPRQGPRTRRDLAHAHRHRARHGRVHGPRTGPGT
ncbi:hypothetical protein ACN20G_30905 (plasmid) [Streptomyces sp. BI20]|uniref:hypothetical protein n=1 Tax=Streptomyces sp. BI20 TaxID=3403460 RepID=UPI003C71E17E